MAKYVQDEIAWVSGIYQLETIDPVEGGEYDYSTTAGGVSNRQATELAMRTVWLKDNIERYEKYIAEELYGLGAIKNPLTNRWTGLWYPPGNDRPDEWKTGTLGDIGDLKDLTNYLSGIIEDNQGIIVNRFDRLEDKFADHIAWGEPKSGTNVIHEVIPSEYLKDYSIPGSALGTGKIVPKSIGYRDIADLSITQNHIGLLQIYGEERTDDAPPFIMSGHIGYKTVGEVNLADFSISSDKLQKGAVDENSLADGSIKTYILADESVTEQKLAQGAVTDSRVSINTLSYNKIQKFKTEELDFLTVDKYDEDEDANYTEEISTMNLDTFLQAFWDKFKNHSHFIDDILDIGGDPHYVLGSPLQELWIQQIKSDDYTDGEDDGKDYCVYKNQNATKVVIDWMTNKKKLFISANSKNDTTESFEFYRGNRTAYLGFSGFKLVQKNMTHVDPDEDLSIPVTGYDISFDWNGISGIAFNKSNYTIALDLTAKSGLIKSLREHSSECFIEIDYNYGHTFEKPIFAYSDGDQSNSFPESFLPDYTTKNKSTPSY
jgi:hypothetical protein